MRHKCKDERLKPICDQRGAAQCGMCSTLMQARPPDLSLTGKRDRLTAVLQQDRTGQVCVCAMNV